MRSIFSCVVENGNDMDKRSRHSGLIAYHPGKTAQKEARQGSINDHFRRLESGRINNNRFGPLCLTDTEGTSATKDFS